jgi:Fe-S-cluster containining protein
MEIESSLPGNDTCFSCRGCCVFHAADSPWRPYFSEPEIERSIAAGISADAFPERQGGRIRTVPMGDRVRCPALDPATHACTIYPIRPLDCQLYPFVLIWDADRKQVSLGLHEACPFAQETDGRTQLAEQVKTLVHLFQTDQMIKTVLANPDCIMTANIETVSLSPLTPLTNALQNKPVSP